MFAVKVPFAQCEVFVLQRDCALFPAVFLFSLPIVRVCAVLAQVVLIEKLLLHGRDCGVKHEVVPCHEREFLEDDGVMHGVHWVCTPCERAMAVDEHGGSIICLPNKVVIEGENTAEDLDSESSPKIDAVT